MERREEEERRREGENEKKVNLETNINMLEKHVRCNKA